MAQDSYVIQLDRCGKDDVRKGGGKGANLGEMLRIGIPVPAGFVVTTAAFDLLVTSHNLEERVMDTIRKTDVDDTAQLVEASTKMKEVVLSCDMPQAVRSGIGKAYRELAEILDKPEPPVAVRSSATAEDLPSASFAGQQASFLNVRGEGALVDSIRKCWASLFEPRAIFYRAKHGFSNVSIAVIVQKMINADKSGVMFTVDPTTGEDAVLVEATWGLGESIVGGEVSPDSYRVSKSGEILDVQVSNKTKARILDYASGTTMEVETPPDKATARVLTDGEVQSLAKYAVILEKHYGRPQDIEFAIERGEISIVQTRAVTTQGKAGKIDIKGKELLRGIGASPGAASGRVKIIVEKKDITRIEKGEIIVTTMTSPDLVPAMSKSAAIITDLGGRTSHAAIVSREMGIPAVVGTRQATRVLREGQEITVDAYSGVIYQGRIEVAPVKADSTSSTAAPGTTRTKVKVNLVFARALDELAPKADGVGLLRIEHMITQSGVHPAKLVREGKQEQYIKILMEGIRPIAQAFHPRPVWVRTLDARSDEFRNLQGGEDEPHEANPMLGWHGIRRSLDEPELLKAEFRAVKRLHEEEGLDNVKVMLPFVISVEEVRKAKSIARKEVGLPDTAEIGIMVETPASVMIIEDLCREGTAFASFGTNDLTQLTLGIDRNDEKLARLSSAFHPAVLRSMKQVIDVCSRYGVETSICGESGSDPEMVKILVGYGMASVSCNADAVDTVRSAVNKMEQQDTEAQEGPR